MATLNPVILKDKMLKDGRHTIRIAVRHKSKTAYITTRVVVDSLTQFRGGRVVRRPDATALNAKLQMLLDTYQSRLDDIPHQDMYTAAQIKKMIEKDPDLTGNTLFAIRDAYLNGLRAKGKDTYATYVERSCRYFAEYVRGDIVLSDITPEMVCGYRESLVARNLSEATISTMLAQLKAVINKAIKEDMAEYRVHPFRDVAITPAPVRKLDISLSNFNKIKNAEVYVRNRVVAKDLFLLSFYLGGMNLIDIMNTDFRGKVISYARSKTVDRVTSSRMVEITVQPEARRIISRWMDKRTGKLRFGYNMPHKNFSQWVTFSLKELAEESGVTERITYYSARKTFAQYACELGIPDSIIDYCLGHSDKSKGIIRYYTHVSHQKADMAISRVIDYTKHPAKYKEYIEMRSDIMMMRG